MRGVLVGIQSQLAFLKTQASLINSVYTARARALYLNQFHYDILHNLWYYFRQCRSWEAVYMFKPNFEASACQSSFWFQSSPATWTPAL